MIFSDWKYPPLFKKDSCVNMSSFVEDCSRIFLDTKNFTVRVSTGYEFPKKNAS